MRRVIVIQDAPAAQVDQMAPVALDAPVAQVAPLGPVGAPLESVADRQ